MLLLAARMTSLTLSSACSSDCTIPMLSRHEVRTHALTPDVDRSPFSVTETGWGEFEVQIKIFFVPEAGEKPLTVLHHLKLHPWSGPASLPPVPAAEPGPSAEAPAAPALPPVVHSWQYEEIVFPEPLESFYEILLAHPPTPWPATSSASYAEADASTGETQAHVVHTPTGQILDALSLEAQRAEADRIDLARSNAVQQLEADRSRLIHLEKLVREGRARLAKLETAPP